MKKIIVFSLLLFNLCSFQIDTYEYKAYIFLAEECPVCNNLGKTIKELSTEYKNRIEFIGVFPQKLSNTKTANQFKANYGIELLKIEIDNDKSLTNKFNASVTPEVVLINSKEEILYQGRINDTYAAPGRMRHGKVTEDLKIAIEKVLNNEEVPKPWPDPIGCYITKI